PPGAAALESVRRGGNLPGAFALESVRRGRGRERSHGWRERAEAKRAGAWSDGERPSGRSRARRPLESAPRATRDRSHAPPRHPRRRARHRAPHGRLRRPGRPAPASRRRALPVRARVPRRRARRHERRPARDRRVRGAPPAVGRPRRGALARRAPRPPRPRPRRAPRGAPARRRPRARPPARDRAHARGRLLRARRVQRRLARRPAAQGVDRLRALPAPPRLRRGRRGARSPARGHRARRRRRTLVGAADPAAARDRARAAHHPLVTKGASPTMANPPLHLVDLLGLEREWVLGLFERADRLRARRPAALRERAGHAPKPLAGRTAALVFHKPSLRTRVSFTVGMHELGGDAVDLSAAEVSENGRESLKDVAHVLSSMTQLIVIRTFTHGVVLALAEHATVPVINALTDFSHPCQILSDLYTLWRAERDLDSITVAWVGDGNNVLHSWLQAATIFGFDLNVAVPDGFEPDGGLFLGAERRSRGSIRRFREPREAVHAADVVYTDTWV